MYSLRFSGMSGKLVFVLLISLAWAASAWAAYVERVDITGDGAEEVPGQTVSFAPATGTVEKIEVVESEDDDDDRVFVILTLSDDATTEGVMTFEGDGPALQVDTPAISEGQSLSIDVGLGQAVVTGSPAVPDLRDAPGLRSPVWGAYLGGGVHEVDVPSIGVGLRITNDLETFVVRTDPDVQAETLTGGIFYTSPSLGGFMVSAEWFEDEEEYRENVPEGGDVTGNVNIDFNPNDETTGILYGAAGLEVDVRNDIEFWRIGGNFLPADKYDLPYGLKWSPKAEFTHLEQDTVATSLPPAFGGDIVDTRHISIEGDYLDIGVDFYRPFYLSRHFKWWPRVELGVQHANMKLDAREEFVCSICGPDASFQIDLRSEDDLFTWTAGVGLGAAFMFDTNGSGSPDAMLFGDAGYRTRGDALRAFFPVTGDDLFIDNRSAEITDGGDFDETRFQIGISKSF